MQLNRFDVVTEYITLLNQLCRCYPAFMFSHIPAVKAQFSVSP